MNTGLGPFFFCFLCAFYSRVVVVLSVVFLRSCGPLWGNICKGICRDPWTEKVVSTQTFPRVLSGPVQVEKSITMLCRSGCNKVIIGNMRPLGLS